MATQAVPTSISTAPWHDLVLPKEHGSWSLAFEPVALGLLCAPSLAGLGLSVAIAAGFFARRPLRMLAREARPARRLQARRIVATCAGVAVLGVSAAVALAGTAWLAWLIPAVVCGGVFAAYDLRNGGREEVAEIAGALAFASLPAAFGALASFSREYVAALALLMICRAVPAVIFVRAAVRGRKRGERDFAAALAASVVALAIAAGLTALRLAPVAGAVGMAFFVGRIGFVASRPAIRPKQIGIFEAVSGAGFVVLVAATW